MKRKVVFAFILCLNVLTVHPQIPDGFPSVSEAELPGSKITPPRIFNGSSLFGYINGGAELFLEYGFSLVTVSEIDFMGGKYKTEIYKMNGSEEAFGIFSVSKFKCQSFPSIAAYTCQTKYQLQICKGPYYISIINRTGSVNDSIASVRIGNLIAGKIREGDTDLSKWLPGMDIAKCWSISILVKGRLGVINGIPDLEDTFSGIAGFTALIMDDDKRYISIRFQDDESLNSFLNQNKWTGNADEQKVILKQLSDLHLLFVREK